MRWLGVLLIAWLSASLATAQDGDAVACSANGKNRAYRRKLWDGYEISLGPTRNRAGGGDECTAAIYNAAGKVVFRTTGFSVVLDEDQTGEDLDDDGKPEVVFRTDTGGGNHCCWAYNVVSLFPKPHKLFDLAAAGKIDFEKDGAGRTLIWMREAGPYGYTSMAANPFAERAFRIRGGKLVDVTPEFCPRLLSDRNEDYTFWQRELTPERIQRFQSTPPAMQGRAEFEDLVSALLSRALQNVFCRDFEGAVRDLDLWPATTRGKLKADFARRTKDDYPDFAVRVMAPQ